MNRSLADARSRVLALATVAELRVVLDDIYEETGIRHLAAQRLGQLGEAGRQALLYAFDTAKENPPGRVAALQALVRYFPQESEATLSQALHDPWLRVRKSARLLSPNPCPSDETLQIPPETERMSLPLEHKATLWQAIGTAQHAEELPYLVRTLANFNPGEETLLSSDNLMIINQIEPLNPTVLYAIQARFPGLQNDITHQINRARHPIQSRKTTIISKSLLKLEKAIVKFGAQAIPLLEGALQAHPRNPSSLTYVLTKICSRQSQEKHGGAGATSKQLPPIPLPSHMLDLYSKHLFSQDDTLVRSALCVLPFDPSPEINVLLWILADDLSVPRLNRQCAHNKLELWRRYNGHRKR